jgi:hypothetical protein
MDFFSEAGVPAVAMASAITAAAGAYLNAKLSISTDLSTIFNDRAFGKRLAERMGQLGESATIYKMLERVVDVEGHGATDAVWFEQKTWSYAQLKECGCPFILFRTCQSLTRHSSGRPLCSSPTQPRSQVR